MNIDLAMVRNIHRYGELLIIKLSMVLGLNIEILILSLILRKKNLTGSLLSMSDLQPSLTNRARYELSNDNLSKLRTS